MRHPFKITLLGIAIVAGGLQVAARAQEPAPAQKPAAEKPAPAPRDRTLVPLRLQFVVSKYQGEKKISSLPYSVSLSANGGTNRLRMGGKVPFATTVFGDGKPAQSYTFQDVGIGIDATAATLESGQFRVDVSVTDTSVSSNSQVSGAPTTANIPIVRTFSTNNGLVLRDGQTVQVTAAADPISGDVMRVDVTLTVVK